MYWLSVNERLPDAGMPVFVWAEPDTYVAAYYPECPRCHNTEHFANADWCADLYQATQWMYLPKPPAPKQGRTLRYERNKVHSKHVFNRILTKKGTV